MHYIAIIVFLMVWALASFAMSSMGVSTWWAIGVGLVVAVVAFGLFAWWAIANNLDV